MNYNEEFPLNNFFSFDEEEEASDSNKKKIIEKVAPSNSAEITNDFSLEELEEINSEVLSSLKKSISEEKYRAFFEGSLTVGSVTDSTITFLVPSSFIRKMINQYYMENLSESISNALGKRYQIVVNVLGSSSEDKEELSQKPGNSSQIENNYNVRRSNSVKGTSFSISNDLMPSLDNSSLEARVEEQFISKQDGLSSFGKTVDAKKCFTNFVVGPSNNLAHASSVAVSKGPGEIYSSLYIHGNSGLGKTHLLHAIANKIGEDFPSHKIYITTANEFMSEMISAIQVKNIQSFRSKYSEQIDVLMIDDIHELKNKPGTQNEFFHVFNELQRKKKQLIFTSDKDPKEINGIEDRIRTRLSSALVVEIQQPDFETRIAILKRKAMEEDIYLPDDVVNLIASCIKSNIRELEGSLIKLGAYSSVFNVDIDLETAKEQLKLDIEDERKTINTETITKTVSSYFKIPVPDIRSKARNKEITLARHIAMYFSYYLAKSTLTEIGNYFGKRDHTSVMHGVNKIKGRNKDREFSQTLYEIESLL
jgi:chromosomal replication initiator protein